MANSVYDKTSDVAQLDIYSGARITTLQPAPPEAISLCRTEPNLWPS